MKLLTGLQVVLGTLALLDSIFLAMARHYPTSNDGITIPLPSPNYMIDTSLVIIGAAIFIAALVQLFMKSRSAGLQVFLGAFISIVAWGLYRVALGHYSYTTGTYWLVFVEMAAAIVVVVTGLLQFLADRTPIQA